MASLHCARSPKLPVERSPLGGLEQQELVRSTATRAEAIHRYQAILGIRGSGPEGGFDAKLVVLFEENEHMRVELVGPFGGTRWAALTEATGITVLFPGSDEYLREEESASVIAQLLGISLGSREIVAILRGAGLPVSHVSQPTEAFRMGERRQLQFGAGRWLIFDDDGQVVQAIESHYRAEYPRSWLANNRQVPRRIRLESDTLRATLTVEELEINTALHPEAFELEIPADATRVRPAQIGSEAVFVRPPPSEY